MPMQDKTQSPVINEIGQEWPQTAVKPFPAEIQQNNNKEGTYLLMRGTASQSLICFSIHSSCVLHHSKCQISNVTALTIKAGIYWHSLKVN